MNDAIKPAVSHPSARNAAIKTYDFWIAQSSREEAFDHAIAEYLIALNHPSVKPAVSDEMVEAAAKAYWIECYGKHRGGAKWPDDVIGGSQDLFRAGCRAALLSALAAQGQEPVAVKALEWEEDPAGNWRSRTPFGDEFIQKWQISGADEMVFEYEGTEFQTVEAAKTVAQSYYEGRISAALTAPAQPVASIVPEHCSGSAFVFVNGCLHVKKDGSGYIVVDEDDFVLEDDRDSEGGSVHWITRFPAGEMSALRDFLNGQQFTAAPQHPVEGGWRPTHRHKKRGSTYTVIATGRLQVDCDLDMESVTIYRAEDGTTWVRPDYEFNDGRFEVLPPAPANGGEQ